MSGIADWQVVLGYVLTLASVLLCVVYGAVNWNKPREDETAEIREEADWEERDPDLNEGGVK